MSVLCECLFKVIGFVVLIYDIDIVYWVLMRSNDNGGLWLIICWFIRWLLKDDVMNYKRNVSKVVLFVVGLFDDVFFFVVRIFDYLMLRM